MDKYAKPDYRIQHCWSKITPEAIRVTFIRKPTIIYKYPLLTMMTFLAPSVATVAYSASRLDQSHTAFNEWLLDASLIFLVISGLILLFVAGIGTLYRITITHDAVLVGLRRKMARADFGQFAIEESYLNKRIIISLNYTYGVKLYSFGGSWDNLKAIKFAAQMNFYLRSFKRTANEQQPTHEELRQARPTDF